MRVSTGLISDLTNASRKLYGGETRHDGRLDMPFGISSRFVQYAATSTFHVVFGVNLRNKG